MQKTLILKLYSKYKSAYLFQVCVLLIIQNKQKQQMKDQNQFGQNHPNSFRIKARNLRAKYQQVSHFQIGEMIGKGGFANVYKAIQMNTRSEVAVKVVEIGSLSDKDRHHLQREISIQTMLNHPNIVRIYETVWTDSKAYIFMELVKGQELFNYLNNHGPMNQVAAAKVFAQIVDAVKYMHEHNIAHRDIKTQNIIIDSDYNAKLIDFGLAKIYNSPTNDYLQTFCGSPSYVAPELLENKRYSGQRVDIWCLGVTLYTMLEACLPFDGFDRKMRQSNICYLNWHKPIFSCPEATQLYKSIFKKQRLRISIEDILHSEFFSKHKILQGTKNSQFLSENLLNQQESQVVLQKTSRLLNIEEAQLRSIIRNKKLGQAYCVFYLLWAKRQKFDLQQKVRKQSKSEDRTIDSSKQSFHTLEPRSLKKPNQNRPKSRHQSSIIRMLPVIHDGHHHHNHVSNTPSKVHKVKQNERNIRIQAGNGYEKLLNESSSKFHLDIINKEQVAKEAIKIKAKRFKNIFSKDLNDMDFNIKINTKDIKDVKPRLREDSPESPKRILDCVKIYN